jgi:hypothetical protein
MLYINICYGFIWFNPAFVPCLFTLSRQVYVGLRPSRPFSFLVVFLFIFLSPFIPIRSIRPRSGDSVMGVKFFYRSYTMKKLSVLFLCLAAAVLAVGCVSAPAASQAQENVPDWLNDFPPEDVLWGVGTAKQSTESLSMTMAEARARQSIAQQLGTNARGMITDYARDAGSGDSQDSTQLAEAVARQLTNAQLTGAIPIKRWKAADGTWWYLVQYSKSEAAKAAADIITTEAARYAEFKTLDALKMMDAELAAQKERSAPVTE